jgi:hypothetical protein
MRLLNSKSLELSEFYDTEIPPYAILSHTWGKEEVTLQDIQRPDVQNKAGFAKIMGCCNQAKLDGIEWVWIDTCCIDKTSSAELSEAINSMYAWYKDSEVCYAFLADVPPLDPFFPKDAFEKARWFKRGWCLQELIAPRKIEFYAKDWTEIGTKWSLHSQIERITGIPADFLLQNTALANYTAAQKMSWASERRTTRREDEAYCLLGIFGISMPLLYGEGRRAFYRLQEEMMKQTEDYSLFLWMESGSNLQSLYLPGVFAPSPASFPIAGPYSSSGKHCSYRNIKSIFLDSGAAMGLPRGFEQRNPPQITPRGLHLHACVQKVKSKHDATSLLLWTGCMHEQDYMCIPLREDKRSGFLKFGKILGNPKYNGIALVDRKSFKSFEMSDLYLNTDLCIVIEPMQTWERRDLEIILTTKCEEKVSFVEAFPPITIHDTGSCTQGQRMYCSRVTVEMSNLKFSVCQAESGIPTGHFTIAVQFRELGLALWCNLVTDSDTTSISPGAWGESFRNYGIGIAAQNSRIRVGGVSDRAVGQLRSGRVVYVAVNGTRNPGPCGFQNDPIQRKPACFTLHVSLLATGKGLGSTSEA